MPDSPVPVWFPPSMKILALSTSTPRGGAAIVEGDRVLGASSYEDLAAHAERLFGAIDEALRAAGLTRADVGALACDIGPGSFTGVRVAVAAAKGIAIALGVGVVPIVSLEAMAYARRGSNGPGPGATLTIVDAKKGELFAAAYGAGGEALLEPRHLPREDAGALAAELDARIAGAPFAVVGRIAEELEPLRARLVTGEALDLPDAGTVGRLAATRAAVDPAALDPLYVRAPDIGPPRVAGT